MGVGQIISGTFGTIKERFGSLLGLWVTYFALTIVATVIFIVGLGAVGLAGFGLMGGAESLSEGGALAAGGGVIALVIVFYIGYLLVVMAEYASLILMASPIDRPAFGTAFSAGWRAAPALLLLMLVLLVVYFVAAFVLSIAASALGDTGSLVLAVVCIPLLVWVGSRLCPIYAVVAVDRVRNPFKAIARSWQMTRGHALTIFLASLVFLVIALVVGGIALAPSFGLIASLADPTSAADVGSAVGGFLLLMLGFLVVSALFTIGYSAFMATVHGILAGGAEEAAEAFA